MEVTSPAYFFTEAHFPAPDLFSQAVHVWDLLANLSTWCLRHVKRTHIRGKVSKRAVVEGPVIIGKGTVVEAGAHIRGPVMIGRDCVIRHNAYLRGEVVVGNGVVIGNACELKRAVCADEAEVPHLAYAGDSLLGYKAHLGAGVILSNVKLTRDPVRVRIHEVVYETGLRKFGAVIGDESEIGCHAVLNPGSLIGPRCLVYPLVSWHGYLPAHHIVKYRQKLQTVERRS